MKKMLTRLNIQHYRRSLETETDESKRRTLLRLLAEEEEKQKALNKPKEG